LILSDNKVVNEVLNELRSARINHEDFHSRWEGFCVLQEEMCELWKEVCEKEPPKKLMRQEAIQVAAMAIKFVEDCC